MVKILLSENEIGTNAVPTASNTITATAAVSFLSLLFRWRIEGKWKLLLTYDGEVNRYQSTHPRTEKKPQLFDLSKDPHEKTNLAKKHPEVVAALAAKIAGWWPLKERKVITKYE